MRSSRRCHRVLRRPPCPPMPATAGVGLPAFRSRRVCVISLVAISASVTNAGASADGLIPAAWRPGAPNGEAWYPCEPPPVCPAPSVTAAGVEDADAAAASYAIATAATDVMDGPTSSSGRVDGDATPCGRRTFLGVPRPTGAAFTALFPFLFPWLLAFRLTVPSAASRRWPATLVAAILWALAATATIVYTTKWVRCALGSSGLRLPSEVIDLTLLAAAASVTDVVEALGERSDDAAVAHVLGVNLFDAGVGLGLAWLIGVLVVGQPLRTSTNSLCEPSLPLLLLFGANGVALVVLGFSPWLVGRLQAGVFLRPYSLFVVLVFVVGIFKGGMIERGTRLSKRASGPKESGAAGAAKRKWMGAPTRRAATARRPSRGRWPPWWHRDARRSSAAPVQFDGPPPASPRRRRCGAVAVTAAAVVWPAAATQRHHPPTAAAVGAGERAGGGETCPHRRPRGARVRAATAHCAARRRQRRDGRAVGHSRNKSAILRVSLPLWSGESRARVAAVHDAARARRLGGERLRWLPRLCFKKATGFFFFKQQRWPIEIFVPACGHMATTQDLVECPRISLGVASPH